MSFYLILSRFHSQSVSSNIHNVEHFISSSSTYTDSGCFQTWGRCHSDQGSAPWSDRFQSAALQPDRWLSQKAWIPSGAPCQNSLPWWSHLLRHNIHKTIAYIKYCILEVVFWLGGSVELTSVGINLKPRGDAVSVHDAVFDLSINPHVCVVGLHAQHERPRWLVLQNRCIVVLTLRAETSQSGWWKSSRCVYVSQYGIKYGTWSNTGLLLLISLIPTMTCAALLSG